MASITYDTIPLSIPYLSGNEWKYIKECLDTNWVSSVGAYVDRFEREIAEFCGADFAVATMNGTSALQLSLALAGVQKGDHVIVPNITFVASANAVSYVGAEAIFVDAELGSLQMDLELLASFLDKQTHQKNGYCHVISSGRRIPVIMPVHVLGNTVNMERLLSIAKKHNIKIVEDATESLGSSFKEKGAGTMGLFGCLSFNGNKIITTGGGGMILTDNEDLARKAKHLSTQAKASPTEYFHDEMGYNFRLVNILAALGVAQLEKLPEILAHRKSVFQLYRDMLSPIMEIKFPKIIEGCMPNHWLISVFAERKNELIQFLGQKGIQSRSIWVPMNQLPMHKNHLFVQATDDSSKIYNTCLSLPSSANLSLDQVAYVCNTIKSFYR